MENAIDHEVDALAELAEPLRALRARFEEEVEPYRRPLWGYCLRLTGCAWDAEDLVQEAMQKALAGLASLWQPVNPKAYLFRTATNAWIDRRRRELRVELEALEAEIAGPEPSSDVRLDAHHAIAHLVRVLTPLQRAVFLLCETLDHRAGEAAALLGTTEGAVKAALHRARRALSEAPPMPPAPGARLRADAEIDTLVKSYIAAFDARDPDAIAALLHESATTTIVGCAVELGRETTRRQSLAEWAAEPEPQWARAGVLDGRAALFIFTRDETGGLALHSLLRLETAGGSISAQHIYFFTPELLEHAAAALGLPARTHGRQYQGV